MATGGWTHTEVHWRQKLDSTGCVTDIGKHIKLGIGQLGEGADNEKSQKFNKN